MPARRRLRASPARTEGGSIECLLPELAQKRLAKSWRLRAIEQFLVKCAVWANPRTEGNVDVNMADRVRQRAFKMLPL